MSICHVTVVKQNLTGETDGKTTFAYPLAVFNQNEIFLDATANCTVLASKPSWAGRVKCFGVK